MFEIRNYYSNKSDEFLKNTYNSLNETLERIGKEYDALPDFIQLKSHLGDEIYNLYAEMGSVLRECRNRGIEI